MASIPRLFADAPLGPGVLVSATPAQAHHLGHVLRRSVGDPLLLFNGQDGEWLARLAALRRDEARLMVDRLVRRQQPDSDVWLGFALLKRDATDLVVQKATELGVAALLPLVTERSNANRTNPGRLATIAIEAAEQSERLTLPQFHPVQPLSHLLASWPANRRLCVAAERTDAPWLRPVAGPVGLLVGPEGGFAPTELDALRRRPFVTVVSLGPRVLRAETACLAGLALLQAPGCG